ncbi:MAG: hypothetical protein CME02_05045 [Geminicoccus sp.]|nr:hypothetical protein [Geminicoccus sp.]
MLWIFVILLWMVFTIQLIKGLRANGPLSALQKLSWQMDLAYAKWSSVVVIRIVGVIALLVSVFFVPDEARLAALAWVMPALALWGGIYWLFNHYWVGRVTFPPIGREVFACAEDNAVDLGLQVIGVEPNGVAKAFPATMPYFYPQIPDEIEGNPIRVTYCSLCHSGPVYDLRVDGKPLTFSLIGAISYNATFSDTITGSWWRQETREPAKGPPRGHVLEDVAFEQMTLGDWLDKPPDSTLLPYDPAFVGPYTFTTELQSYKASKPTWHMVGDPPLVLSVVTDGAARAYNWSQLKSHSLVNDSVAGPDLLVLTDPEQVTGAVYDCSLDGHSLSFERAGDGSITDTETGSSWDHFGRCTKRKLEGKALRLIKSFQQYVRGWITFHAQTTFYEC